MGHKKKVGASARENLADFVFPLRSFQELYAPPRGSLFHAVTLPAR